MPKAAPDYAGLTAAARRIARKEKGMHVSVTTVVYGGGTVASAIGTDMETGRWITFAGDHRPMLAIAEALADGEDVEVEVEDWQITGTAESIAAWMKSLDMEVDPR